MAILQVISQGVFNNIEHDSVALAATQAYDILASNQEGCELIHCILDNGVKVWKNEGSKSMIQLFKLIYPEEVIRRRFNN